MTVKVWPTLFGLSSTGKMKQWTISVDITVEGAGVITTAHGYVEQTITVNHKHINKGKNIGKINQTTPYEHEFTKRGHNVVYPCYVQPKLNGARCLIKKLNHAMRATSRGGKEYRAIETIKNDLMDAMDTFDILDGELYNHELSFQEIMTAIKNETDLDINLSRIQYWVYDLAMEGLFFDERYKIISQMVAYADSDSIVLVPTYLVHNEQELAERHAEFTAQGFEGTMIRNTDGVYKFKHRSVDLQKYKDFQDAEFEIVDGAEGVGLSAGQCVFVCKTHDDKLFSVRCIGPNSVREEQWINLQSYKRKYLKVKFQNYSDDGIPIFPVGIEVREGMVVNGMFEPLI